MDDKVRPSTDVRLFLTLFIVVLLFSAAILLIQVIYGRVPLLGSLPGDFSIVVGTTPVLIPLGTSVLISLALTSIASLVSLFMRDK